MQWEEVSHRYIDGRESEVMTRAIICRVASRQQGLAKTKWDAPNHVRKRLPALPHYTPHLHMLTSLLGAPLCVPRQSESARCIATHVDVAFGWDQKLLFACPQAQLPNLICKRNLTYLLVTIVNSTPKICHLRRKSTSKTPFHPSLKCTRVISMNLDRPP